MATLYTVDAGVFVSAYNDYEVSHEESYQALELLRERAIPLLEPTLLLAEIAASVARAYQDENLARTFANSVRDLSHLSLIALDRQTAGLAVDIAARHRLRGSDSVYVAVALRYGALLITQDNEQYECGGEIVTARRPLEILAGIDD